MELSGFDHRQRSRIGLKCSVIFSVDSPEKIEKAEGEMGIMVKLQGLILGGK